MIAPAATRAASFRVRQQDPRALSILSNIACRHPQRLSSTLASRRFHSSSVPRDEPKRPPGVEHTLPLRFPKDHTLTHYQKLGVPMSASHRDIKRKFKQLSKLYHPDIVTNNPKFEALSDEDKKTNNENYIQLVHSYETLSDTKRRTAYDVQIKKTGGGGSGHFNPAARSSDIKSKYYGEAKYYSRSGGSRGSSSSYSPSGMNFSRGRVHYGPQYDSAGNSMFHGKPNSNAKDGVPHFDYDKHLERQLKVEERFLNKKMREMGSTLSLKETAYYINGDRRFHNIYRHKKKHSGDGEE